MGVVFINCGDSAHGLSTKLNCCTVHVHVHVVIVLSRYSSRERCFFCCSACCSSRTLGQQRLSAQVVEGHLASTKTRATRLQRGITPP